MPSRRETLELLGIAVSRRNLRAYQGLRKILIETRMRPFRKSPRSLLKSKLKSRPRSNSLPQKSRSLEP